MPAKHDSSVVVTRLLPYAFLCTIGPSVAAATSLYVVRIIMCRYHERDGNPSDATCHSPAVGALTASVFTGLAVIDGLFSFLSTSLVQSLADKYGRRPLLYTLPLIATLASGAMVVAYLTTNIKLAWVMLALNGVAISASTKSIFTPTLSVADVADEQQRTNFYSRLEAVSLLGPGTAYVMSALASRYIPITLFPYYIAIGSQVFAAFYAAVSIPETLRREDRDKSDEEDDDEEEEEEHALLAEAVEAVAAPVKPLGLLLPHRDMGTGRWEWRLSLLTLSLLATTCGTVFIATASLLYLSDKFNFQPEANGWVLAYITFSKFAFIILVFPYIQRSGRRLYHWYQTRKTSTDPERRRLIQRDSFRKREAATEANHFDVILLFFSVCLDAVALIMISFSSTYQQALISFGFLALGSGDNPTYKSVFTSMVTEDLASEALAALDMVWNAARLFGPLLLGGLYAGLVEVGRPELLFLIAGTCCVAGAVLLIPIIILGERSTT